MSKRAHPAIIGTFVLGALAVVIAAIALLGSGTWLGQTERYVLFFDGNLSGLDVGAPVEYRGVRVGSVSEIRLEYHPDTQQARIPVYIAFDPRRVTRIGPRQGKLGLERMVAHGLRAQLQVQSLLTGQQKIMFVERPDTAAKRVEAETEVPQIPTIPTLTANLTEQLERMPFDRMISNINVSLREIADIARSPEWTNTLGALEQSAGHLAHLLSRMDGTLPGLTSNLAQTSRQLDGTLEEIQRLVDPHSPVRHELTSAMEQVGAAAHAVRELADYLQRHPEAVIKGKP